MNGREHHSASYIKAASGHGESLIGSSSFDASGNALPGANTSFSNHDEVQELVDALSGATWETRNRILRERFAEQLEKDKQRVPRYQPPGQGS